MTLLYSTVEMTRQMYRKPLQAACEFGAWALRANPYALAHGGHELAALFDLCGRVNKSYQKPLWRHEEWGYPVEIESLGGAAFGDLIRFSVPGGPQRKKLLIVAPMSGHYPTLLRETVKAMAKTHDVFLTEWVNARDVPASEGEFSLSDYVDFLRMSLRRMHALDARPIHAMSVCQPTVPMLAAAALMWEDAEAAAPASLIMIGGPIDARKSPTATNGFAEKHSMSWFKSKLISHVPLPYAGVGRRVYPGFLQHMGFVAMNPGRHAQAHGKYFDSLVKGDEAGAARHREFYDEYNAVMDLPEAYYLETVQKVFKDFDLPLGRLELCGRLVKPQAIKAALMTIEGELDDISGAGQTHSARALCPSSDPESSISKTFEGVGHYGVFSGSAFNGKIAPAIGAFMEKAEESKQEKTSMKPAGKAKPAVKAKRSNGER